MTPGEQTIFVARAAFAMVTAAVLANALFNVCANLAGASFPHTIFVFNPKDRFADFFKLVAGYPGLPWHETGSTWLRHQLEGFDAQRAALAGTSTNSFHLPPVDMLIGLIWRRGVVMVDPLSLFVAMLSVGLAAWVAVVARAVPDGHGRWLLGALALVNYPLLFMVDRGHFFSLICAIGIIAATVRSLRMGRADWVSILLFAIVLNMRPNVGLVPLALWLGKRGWRFVDMVVLGMASVALFAVALGAAHALYQPYTLAAFQRGLSDYSSTYVVDGGGTAYGSSLWGAVRSLSLTGPGGLLAATGISAMVYAAGLMAAREGRIGDSGLMFVTLASYALISEVFADYHLMVFVLPIILLARAEWRGSVGQWAILLGSCFVLAPKNYVFFDRLELGLAVSWQVAANPLMLLGAAGAVLAWGTTADRGARRPARPVPPVAPPHRA